MDAQVGTLLNQDTTCRGVVNGHELLNADRLRQPPSEATGAGAVLEKPENVEPLNATLSSSNNTNAR